MIALDIGGTKTLVWFSNKKIMKMFKENIDFDITSEDRSKNYIIFESKNIFNEDGFYRLCLLLRRLDREIISTFPGIVRAEIGKEMKFVVYSRRFSFLIGKEVNFDFVINDAPAFTYHHASHFFKSKMNRDKTLLGIVIGTGINAAYMNYWDFKRLNFINRIYEAGHIMFDGRGEECFCGRKGCAELYVAGKYLEKIGGDPKRVFSDSILRERYYKNLSDYLVSLIITISPHKIVFGGGVSADLDLENIKNLIENNLPHSSLNLDIEIEKDVSILSNIYGLVGIYRNFKRYTKSYIP